MADLQTIQHVKAGNVGALKKCNKKDLSKADESGWCAVHWAAWSGNKDAVLAILSKRLGLLASPQLHGTKYSVLRPHPVNVAAHSRYCSCDDIARCRFADVTSHVVALACCIDAFSLSPSSLAVPT